VVEHILDPRTGRRLEKRGELFAAVKAALFCRRCRGQRPWWGSVVPGPYDGFGVPVPIDELLQLDPVASLGELHGSIEDGMQESQCPGTEDFGLALQPGIDAVGVKLGKLAFPKVRNDVLSARDR
jgi:hypothetical protein